jgi:hypothetical protein
MEGALRNKKIEGGSYNPGQATIICNGCLFTEPDYLYPSEKMVAQVALGLGAT